MNTRRGSSRKGEEEFTTMKVWKRTHRQIKRLAYLKDTSMTEIMHDIVMAQVGREEKKLKEEGV